jgi:hypothetical protein
MQVRYGCIVSADRLSNRLAGNSWRTLLCRALLFYVHYVIRVISSLMIQMHYILKCWACVKNARGLSSEMILYLTHVGMKTEVNLCDAFYIQNCYKQCNAL